MKDCFVIMQIGNPEMDHLWEDVYRPTIGEVGLNPIRVDKHDNGTLLKAQIIRFLDDSKLVIADLTNERPNCYLEVGYVMGINGYERLVLCCREDHNLDSPQHTAGGPKVHFDLQGYGILWWAPARLDTFKLGLQDKMKRRLGTTKMNQYHRTAASPLDEKSWLSYEHRTALQWLKGRS